MFKWYYWELAIRFRQRLWYFLLFMLTLKFHFGHFRLIAFEKFDSETGDYKRLLYRTYIFAQERLSG